MRVLTVAVAVGMLAWLGMMERSVRLQASGEPGALQTNSTPNIFFVRDGAGQLGVVDAIWGGAGWEIGASPFGDKRAWSVGTRVISR